MRIVTKRNVMVDVVNKIIFIDYDLFGEKKISEHVNSDELAKEGWYVKPLLKDSYEDGGEERHIFHIYTEDMEDVKLKPAIAVKIDKDFVWGVFPDEEPIVLISEDRQAVVVLNV